MKFKALRMALAAGFLVTTSAVVGITELAHRLVEQSSASMVAGADRSAD